MRAKEDIEKVLRRVLSDFVTGDDIGMDASLLDREIGIAPVDFLYIFDALEKELSLNVHSILENNTYHVMTIRMLTDAIFNMQDSEHGDSA